MLFRSVANSKVQLINNGYTRRTYCAPESQEVVRVDFHDTDPIPYEQPLNVIPATTERNNLSVAEPMKLSVGSFHLTIPTLLII